MAPRFRARGEPAMMLSVPAGTACSVEPTVMDLTASTSTARLPLSAAMLPVMTPCTMLPAGIGAAVPMMTGSFTTPVQLSPGCAVSDEISAFTVTLIGVPSGTVTPTLTGAGVGVSARGRGACGRGFGVAGVATGAGVGGCW